MLEIKNLHAGYGQSEVLHDISFKVGEAEILAIMGRNGMGKSTLLRTIMGLLPVRSGSIDLDGQDISKKLTYKRVRDGLAYVPQGRMIFSNLTVLDNLYSATARKPEKSTLDEIYALFPVLRDMRNRKGGNLSGGQQQQLAIARALLTDPKVLVLDEPTEGIQPSIIKDIAKTLREIRDLRKLTILVTEQVLSFVADACDRLIVMQRGRFVHDDKIENLRTDDVSRLLAV